jgi:asparaginyl-tRNA synthetase
LSIVATPDVEGLLWLDSMTVRSAPTSADIFRTPLSRKDLSSEDVMNRRHLWARNPTFAAIARYRDDLLWATRSWFRSQGFTEVTPPILTPVTLYDSSTAVPIAVNGESVFLTQCTAYYLEALSLGMGPVLAIGPSFRGAESRSRRHLVEYTHIKAEAPFMTLDDGRILVETWIAHLIEQLTAIHQALPDPVRPAKLPPAPPYRVMTHREAADILHAAGCALPENHAIGSSEEEQLSKLVGAPFWIAYPPADTEPFPYALKADDPTRVLVADLIANDGFGEILGLAQKHQSLDELVGRMGADGRDQDPAYAFVKETIAFGAPPRIAFGAGVERLIRWMLQLDHVKDAIPFPRVIRRRIYP